MELWLCICRKIDDASVEWRVMALETSLYADRVSVSVSTESTLDS